MSLNHRRSCSISQPANLASYRWRRIEHAVDCAAAVAADTPSAGDADLFDRLDANHNGVITLTK